MNHEALLLIFNFLCRMKYIYAVLLCCVGLGQYALAQGTSCSDVQPFCTDSGVTFPAGTGQPQAEVSEPGNDYGCLGSTPNPAWYYLQIEEPGNINILQTNSNSVDVDFILWGPFPTVNAANDACGSLSVIEDCSYSSSAVENINIDNAQTGDVYILLITNFSDQPTEINAGTENSSIGTTDCDIVLCDLTATIAVNSPICLGNSIQLAGSVSAVGNTVTYQWTGPNGFTSTEQNPTIPNATTANNGAYSLEVTVDECTSPAATIDINVVDFTVSVFHTTPTCVGGLLLFQANTTPAVPMPTYEWVGPNGYTATGQSPAINELTLANNGTYTVSVTSSGCPSETASTTLVITQPAAIATANSPVCIGGTLTLNAALEPADGGATYTWTGPNGFSATGSTATVDNFDAAQSGDYWLNASSNGCIAATDTISIGTYQLAATAQQVGSVCSGGSTGEATAAAPAGTSPLAYNWSTGATTVNATDLSAGAYTVTITDANNCIATASATITNFPPPSTTIQGKFDFCEGQTASLDAGNFVSYIWSTGASTPVILPNTAGSYAVTVTDTNGCTATAAATVIQNSALLPTIVGNLLVLPTSSTVLSVEGNYDAYTWSNGSLTPTATVSDSGIYSVTVTDSNECIASNSVQVTKLLVTIPNAFSPNGDDTNDLFHLNFPSQYVTNYQLTIYDRWGQQVFTTDQLSEGWNGEKDGIPLPIGVYAYYLSLTLNGSVQDSYQGNVTLMR